MQLSIKRFVCRGFATILCFAAWLLPCGCSQPNDPPGYLEYLLVSRHPVQAKYGYYKCRYAHYRNHTLVSGSEDIFKVEVGTIISYGDYEHIIIEGEVFDANDWF